MLESSLQLAHKCEGRSVHGSGSTTSLCVSTALPSRGRISSFVARQRTRWDSACKGMFGEADAEIRRAKRERKAQSSRANRRRIGKKESLKEKEECFERHSDLERLSRCSGASLERPHASSPSRRGPTDSSALLCQGTLQRRSRHLRGFGLCASD